MAHRLTWPEFRDRYHEDAVRDHYWQKKADCLGEVVEILHPTHDWVLERFEPEV